MTPVADNLSMLRQALPFHRARPTACRFAAPVKRVIRFQHSCHQFFNPTVPTKHVCHHNSLLWNRTKPRCHTACPLCVCFRSFGKISKQTFVGCCAPRALHLMNRLNASSKTKYRMYAYVIFLKKKMYGAIL